jgi:hypothetical protein
MLWRAYILLGAVLICIGCKNPYSEFYHPYQTVMGNSRLAQPQGDPKIYRYSANVDQDNRAMRENGFVMIGYASFNGAGNAGSQDNVIAQARTVGASVVMVKSADAGTRTGVMPYTTYNPGQVITTT